MITGGLGFIGSTLAHQLVGLGASVLIVDAMIPECGGSFFNVLDIQDRVRLNIADIREATAMNRLVQDVEVIFNLAAQARHTDGTLDPFADLAINCRGHLSLLEACRVYNPFVKIVYASTRRVYGRPVFLPVTERHQLRPRDVSGVTKAAGESYHLLYNDAFGLRTVSLRLTNVYGPRESVRHDRPGSVGRLVRQAIEGREIELDSDGEQPHEFIYVDDAGDAFLRAGASDHCNGRVLNVGASHAVTYRTLAGVLLVLAGNRSRVVRQSPAQTPPECETFRTDSSLIHRTLGWESVTPLRQGLARTFEFYRAHLSQYL